MLLKYEIFNLKKIKMLTLKNKIMERGKYQRTKMLKSGKCVLSYEVRVRFGTRVRMRDSAIFEKGGCGCGGTQRLKNY